MLRIYLDWGVLQETCAKGIYSAGTTLAVEDSRLIAWLAEASLHARANGSAPLKDLIDSPSLFPFRIKPVHAENLVAASSRLDLLLDRGFRVYLTSDHGNVEASGCGRPAEGAVADLRGERVRIYSDAVLRGKVKERFPAALEWGTVGLPEDYLALLAPARQAFVQEKQRTVSHGGVSVEELIVPLIQIERRGE